MLPWASIGAPPAWPRSSWLVTALALWIVAGVPVVAIRSAAGVAQRRPHRRPSIAVARRCSACSSSVNWPSASCWWFRRMLFARSLYNITATDVGFNPKGLQVVGFGDPIMDRLSLAERHAFQQTLLETVESIPGVQSAGAVSQVPLERRQLEPGLSLSAATRTIERQVHLCESRIFPDAPGADSFRTRVSMRPIARSRGRWRSSTTPSCGASSAVRLMRPSSRRSPRPNYPPTAYEVVGRVGNTKYGDVREDDLPIVYVPLAQAPVISTWKSVIVRTVDDTRCASATRSGGASRRSIRASGSA